MTEQDTKAYFIGKVELTDDGDEWLASVMLMGPLDPPYENVGSSRIISRRFFRSKVKMMPLGGSTDMVQLSMVRQSMRGH